MYRTLHHRVSPLDNSSKLTRAFLLSNFNIEQGIDVPSRYLELTRSLRFHSSFRHNRNTNSRHEQTPVLTSRCYPTCLNTLLSFEPPFASSLVSAWAEISCAESAASQEESCEFQYLVWVHRARRAQDGSADGSSDGEQSDGIGIRQSGWDADGGDVGWYDAEHVGHGGC